MGWKGETRHKLVKCFATNRYPQLSSVLRQISAKLSKLAMKLITCLSFLSSWHYSPVLHGNDTRAESELAKDHLHLKMKLVSFTVYF